MIYNIMYIVKKLKQWRQSAGNYIIIYNNIYNYIFSSETIRNNNILYSYNTNLTGISIFNDYYNNSAEGGHIIKNYNNNNNNLDIVTFNYNNNLNNYIYKGNNYKYDNIFKSIKPISVHRPKHLKPLNDEQFGYYLAGYIDAKGYFNIVNNRPQLILIFDIKDYSLAYYIKGYLGYGSVKNLYINDYKYINPAEGDHITKSNHNYNAENYIYNNNPTEGGHSIKLLITSKKGLNKVINLINNKILNINVYNQITKPNINGYNFLHYIYNEENYNNKDYYLNNIKNDYIFKYNNNNNNGYYDLNNHWLAGFIDGNGSFLINLIKIYINKSTTIKNNNIYESYILPKDIDKLISNNKFNHLDKDGNNDYIIDIKLCLNIKYTNNGHKDILTIIKNNLGGYIMAAKGENNNIINTHNKILHNQLDQYLYIDNFKLIRNIILYLDKYHLLSHKFVNYVKWRKIYTILQENRHLTKNGFNKIIKFK